LASGQLLAMPMDGRQSEEIFLTAAQSLFAVVVIMNLRFSITEALILLVLFVTQLFFTEAKSRHIYSFVYIGLAIGWFLIISGNRKSFKGLAKAFINK